jgi:hypothetical protein
MDFDNAFSLANGFPAASNIPLDAFIMEWFVACLVGDSDLYYHGEDRILAWRDLNGEPVEASFAVKHQLNLRVDAPLPGAYRYGRRIDKDKIHEHRMNATDEEFLGIGRNAALTDVKRAKREAAKRFHSDRYQQLESGERYILDLRLKETNAAADRVSARLKPEERPKSDRKRRPDESRKAGDTRTAEDKSTPEQDKRPQHARKPRRPARL